MQQAEPNAIKTLEAVSLILSAMIAVSFVLARFEIELLAIVFAIVIWIGVLIAPLSLIAYVSRAAKGELSKPLFQHMGFLALLLAFLYICSFFYNMIGQMAI